VAKFDLTGISVALAIPINRPIPWQVFIATIDTIDLMRRHGVRVATQLTIGCSFIHLARNLALDTFLHSDCNRLFFLDEDVVWKPDDFLKMVALSTEMDVLCASYPLKQDETKFWFHGNPPFDGDEEKHGCASIFGTGLGFTIINRAVVERLAERAPRVKVHFRDSDFARVFRLEAIDGKEYSEDILFFRDCRDLGYKVWLDPSIELSHIGEKAYTGSVLQLMDKYRRSAGDE